MQYFKQTNIVLYNLLFSKHVSFSTLLLFSVVCPPTSVTAVTDCSNSDITVSWDPSPESGVSYILHSQDYGGASANYSTTQTSHIITGLQCSEMYTFTVATKDSECTSVFSNPIQADTG